jgi:hypothetical protein
MKPPNVTLVSTQISPHVSFDEIKEFEAACKKDTRFSVVQGLPSVPMLKYAAVLIYAISTAIQKFARAQSGNRERPILSVGFISPHHAVYKTFPYFTFGYGRRCIWVYDAWPDRWDAIERFVKRYNIRLLMLSSLQATDHFRSRAMAGCRVEWLPEAVTTENYRQKPYEHRTIDVLQLGRRWDVYHAAIEPYAREQQYAYKYETKPGCLVFPKHEDFLEGLSESKISICVPASLTHPSRSARLETMTWRYLQSMASKCLLLGHTPKEMRQLFGYDPVIPIDTDNPTEQIKDLLTNYHRYEPLIEKNYEHVSRYHQWQNRVETMVQYFDIDRPSTG